MPATARQFAVNKAVRSAVTLKIALMGTSGSGKTVSALRLAYGICPDWNRIYVLDTENNSSLATVNQQYGDLTIGTFAHMPFSPPYDPQSYTDAIQQVNAMHIKDEATGPLVLIIDGFWHVWKGTGGLLEIQKKQGGTFQAWNNTNPEQNKVMDAMRLSPLWIIANMRASTDYVIENIPDPKVPGATTTDIRKVGIGPDMRKDTEYEFGVSFMIDRATHKASVGLGKDRTQIWDKVGYSAEPFVITEETGRMLREWAESGAFRLGSSEWVQAQSVAFDQCPSLDDLRIKWGAVLSLVSRTVRDKDGKLTNVSLLTEEARAILINKKDAVKNRLLAKSK